MTRSRPSARELIGGRWAISRRAFALLCGAVIATSLISPPLWFESPRWSDALDLTLLIVVQCLAAGVVLLVADRTLLRTRRMQPVRVGTVVGVGVLIAVARTVALAILAVSGGAPFPTVGTVLTVTVVTALILGILLPTLAYLFAARDWYTSERARLIALDAQLRAEHLRTSGALDATLDVALEAIEAQLAETRRTAKSLIEADAPDGGAIATALVDAARNSMRPLSHELWETEKREYPVVGWRQVAACEIRRQPLPILVPTVGFVVVALPTLVNRIGGLGTLATVATAIVAINVAFRLGRAGIRRSGALAVPIALASVVAASLPVMAVALFAFPGNAAQIALVLPLLGGLALVAGVAAAIRTTSDDVVAELVQMVQAAEVEQLALTEAHERLRRDLATFLHGTVQSDLITASVALQNAVRTADVAAYDSAVAAAISALDLQYDPQRAVAGSTFADIRANAERTWGGILQLAWDDAGASVPSAATPQLAELVREALTNAVVHGAATRAAVTITGTADGISVCVADNGIGPQHGPPGLGSALLDEATAKDWTLEAGPDGGAIMRATLPC